LAVAILIGSGALAFGTIGEGASSACVGRLPAPITIEAPIYTRTNHYLGTIRYVITCNGRVHRIGKSHSLFSQGEVFSFGADPGVWWAIRHGHLVIGRRRKRVWRSRGEFWSRYGIGSIEISAPTVAFSYGSNLYLAPRGGAERLIGRQEYPLGFTSGGLYTISWLRGLLLRSDTGAILKKIVHWTPQYFAARGRLYFVAHGVLMRASGAPVQRLASLKRLGMSTDTWLQALWTDPWSQRPADLFELDDNHRLTVLRPDGSVFATAGSREWGGGGVFVQPVVAANETAVAFIATTRQGTETYVLRAGARTATAVHREKVHFGGCSGGASLQWHGNWLLYSDTNDDLAAIDTTGAHRTIELTHLITRLRGTKTDFTAYWSGQPPPW
jgi:hypothetical protein